MKKVVAFLTALIVGVFGLSYAAFADGFFINQNSSSFQRIDDRHYHVQSFTVTGNRTISSIDLRIPFMFNFSNISGEVYICANAATRSTIATFSAACASSHIVGGTISGSEAIADDYYYVHKTFSDVTLTSGTYSIVVISSGTYGIGLVLNDGNQYAGGVGGACNGNDDECHGFDQDEYMNELGFRIGAGTDVVSNLAQVKVDENGDDATSVDEGGLVSDNTIRFKATLPDIAGAQLQVEVKKKGEAFDGDGTIDEEDCGVDAGIGRCDFDLTLANPDNGETAKHGPYHWRARAVDGEGDGLTDWEEYGEGEGADFTRAFKVAILLFEPNGEEHQSENIEDSPCKLAGAPEAPTEGYDGYTKEYFEALTYCLSDYYRENSYGQVAFEFDIQNAWTSLPSNNDHAGRNTSYYAAYDDTSHMRDKSAEASRLIDLANDSLAAAEIQDDEYSYVVIVHAGMSEQHSKQTDKDKNDYGKINTITTYGLNGAGKYLAITTVDERDGFGTWAHEFGHGLGDLLEHQPLPDNYKYGENRWDIMSIGNYNERYEGSHDYGEATDPAPLISFERIALGWLGEDIHCIGGNHNFTTPILDSTLGGEEMLRYNLIDSAGCDEPQATPYYLFEGRKREVEGVHWNTSMPGTDANNLLVYRVNGDHSAVQKAALKIGEGDKYWDGTDMLSVTAGELTGSENNSILFNVRALTAEDFPYPMRGISQTPRRSYAPHIPQYNLDQASEDPDFHGQISDPDWEKFVQKPLFETKRAEFLLKWAGILFAAAAAFSYLFWVLQLWWLLAATKGRSSTTFLWAGFISITASLVLLIDIFASGVQSTISLVSSVFSQRAMLWFVCVGSLPIVASTVVYGSSRMESKRNRGLKIYLRVLLAIVAYLFSLMLVFSVTSVVQSAIFETLALSQGVTFVVAAIILVAAYVLRALFTGSVTMLSHISALLRILRALTTITLLAALLSLMMLQWARFEGALASGSNHASIARHAGSMVSAAGGVSLVAPSTHLEVFCTDGRHVGLNSVGVFENEIENSFVSGYNVGDPEWIYIPAVEGNANCQFVVSSREQKQFLDENEDIAAEIEDTSDSYDLYARVIDPETGVHTSAVLTGQTIDPGVGTLYTVATDGEGEPVADEGVTDGDAPTVAIADPEDEFVTTDAEITVSGTADDGEGTGLASVRVGGVSCDVDGTDWTCEGVPVADGEQAVTAVATDMAGNVSTAEVAVAVAPHVTVDEAPDTYTNDPDATVEFHSAEGATFECRTEEDSEWGEWDGCEGERSMEDMDDGLHALEVRATDAAERTGAVKEVVWTVDTVAPTTSASPISPWNYPTYPLAGMLSDAGIGSGSISVEANGDECDLDETGGFTCDPVPLDEGDNEIAATVTDGAGNHREYSWTVTYVPYYTISGTVTDGHSHPVEGAHVTIGTPGTNYGSPVTVYTDEDGVYSAELVAGTVSVFNVTCHDCDAASRPHDFYLWVESGVPELTEDAEYDITLPPTAQLGVSVQDVSDWENPFWVEGAVAYFDGIGQVENLVDVGPFSGWLSMYDVSEETDSSGWTTLDAFTTDQSNGIYGSLLVLTAPGHSPSYRYPSVASNGYSVTTITFTQ